MSQAARIDLRAHAAAAPIRAVAATSATAVLLVLSGLVINPLYLAAAIAGCAGLWCAVRIPELVVALWVVGIVVPYHPVLGKLQLGGACLIAVALATRVIARPHEALNRARSAAAPLAAAIALLGWLIASIMWAGDPTLAPEILLRWVLAITGFAGVLMFIQHRRQLLLVAHAWLAGCAALAFSARAELFTDVAVADGDLTSAAGRVSGASADPNLFAATMLAAVWVSIGCAFTSTRTVARWLYAGGAAVAAAMIFASASRGALIALVVTLAIAPIVLRARRIHYALGGAAVITLTGLMAALNPGAFTRLTSFSEGGSGRSTLWSIAVAIWREHPIIGVGPNGFLALEAGYLRDVGPIIDSAPVTRGLHAHSTVLQLAAEAGAIGVLLHVAVLGIALAGVVVHRRDRLMCGIGLATLGAATCGLFISMGPDYRLWALYGMCALGLHLPHTERTSP